MTRLTLIAATSLDGFIAKHDKAGTDFCSDADAAFLRDALRQFDSLILGRKTFDTLRERILNSNTNRYLRKIMTRDPAAYSDCQRENRVEFTDATPADILAELASRGRARTALLGGSDIYSAFLEANLVDELWLTLEPQLFGTGTPLANQTLDLRYELASAQNLSPNTLLLKYRREN